MARLLRFGHRYRPPLRVFQRDELERVHERHGAHEASAELGGDEVLALDRAAEHGLWRALSGHRVPLGPAGRSLYRDERKGQ
jgi:hypothetical protein